MKQEARAVAVSSEVAEQLYKTLLRYWRSRGCYFDAEDLAQEGVLKCLEVAHQWEGKSSLLTFLVVVGKRKGLDYLRGNARHARNKDVVRNAWDIVYGSQRRTKPAPNPDKVKSHRDDTDDPEASALCKP